MKYISVLVGLIIMSQAAFSQSTMTLTRYDSLMKLDRGLDTPLNFPRVSCDTLYQRLTGYMRNKRMGIKSSALIALTKLYRECQNGDSCSTVRTKIIKDFLTYIQVDSLLNSLESELSRMSDVLSIEEVRRLRGREIIIEIFNRKGLRVPPLASFIIPFKLIEILPLYRDLFNKTNPEENGGHDKTYLLLKMIAIGDTSSITLYKKTLWDYTKDPRQLIEEGYFYQLLSSIRLLKNKGIVQQIFEMLAYVNTHQDKKIYIRTDSDTDKPMYWFLGQVLFSGILCDNVTNLPKQYCHYPSPKYTKENVENLLKWCRADPNRIILK